MMTVQEDFKEMWSIQIYSGNSPFHLKPTKGSLISSITRHDVTDIPASFVADPFMIKVDNTWYLFMEILNGETGLGEIGLVTSSDGIKWDYQQVILKEDYHLSYPFIFEHQGIYYMIPETLDAKAIRLYKATNFPYDWVFERDLVKGRYADPTIFQYNNQWWIFAGSSPNQNDTLNLFHADKLHGPYIEHLKSPIIEKNKRKARPAGRIIKYDNKLIRLAQDCYPKYGSSVRAFEIITLTTENYSERELPESPILEKSNKKNQWNSRGMHHLDAHQIEDNKWIACVDGCYYDKLILKKRAVWIFDDSYKIPTFLSVASFKAHMDIPITLIFFGDPESEVIEAFENLGGGIDMIIRNKTNHTHKNRRERHLINRLARMEIMRLWPKEQVFLFDGDLMFSKEIKKLESFIDNNFEGIDMNRSLVWGVSEYALDFYTSKLDDYNIRTKTSTKELHQCLKEVQGKNWKKKLSGLQYNNGLLVIHNCFALADAWEVNYRKGMKHPLVNIEDDQIPLCIAMFEQNTQTLKIPSCYNSLGKLSGNYVVYHAWGGKWRLELEKIGAGKKDLEDYGRIAQAYYDRIPSFWIFQKEIV